MNNYKENISLSFQGNVLSYGDRTTVEDTKFPPIISYNKENNKWYTLIMVDPDAPSSKNPINRYWLHWLIINQTNNSEGNIINKYQGPQPPNGTGTHRYYTCIFEQGGKILKLNELQREKFSLSKFVEDNGLELISCTKFTVKAKN